MFETRTYVPLLATVLAHQRSLGRTSGFASISAHLDAGLSGKWSRPDIVYADGDHLVSYEVKVSHDVDGVYEALSHARAAHEAHLLVASTGDSYATAIVAKRHGIGLLSVSDLSKPEDFEVVVASETHVPELERVRTLIAAVTAREALGPSPSPTPSSLPRRPRLKAPPPVTVDVLMHGAHVATVDSRYRLAFTEDAFATYPPGYALLSVRLRLSRVEPSWLAVRAYLGSLLPESGTESRSRLVRDADVSLTDSVGLLARFGHDTPGAAVFVPSGEPSPTGRLEPIARADVPERLSHSGSYSSLPGVQPKGALTLVGSDWFVPREGAASTHILKPTQEGAPSLVHDEALSSRAALAVGLRSAVSTVEDFGGVEVLVVPRYDRVVDATGRVERVHQEDGAAALGLSAEEANSKFEWASDVANLRDLASVLTRNGGSAEDLLRLTTLNVLLGNTDAHAKNHSLLHDGRGGVSLAPVYDVSPHGHLGGRMMALYVNGRSRLAAVTLADVVAEAHSWGVREHVARRVVSEVRERLVDFLDTTTDVHELGEETFEWVAERVSSLSAPGGPPPVPTAPTSPGTPSTTSPATCLRPTTGGSPCSRATTGGPCWQHS